MRAQEHSVGGRTSLWSLNGNWVVVRNPWGMSSTVLPIPHIPAPPSYWPHCNLIFWRSSEIKGMLATVCSLCLHSRAVTLMVWAVLLLKIILPSYCGFVGLMLSAVWWVIPLALVRSRPKWSTRRGWARPRSLIPYNIIFLAARWLHCQLKPLKSWKW